MFILTRVLVNGGKLIVTGGHTGISTDNRMPAEFRVNRGTVVASGSAMDISSFGNFVISGGSVNARTIVGGRPKDGSGTPIYLVTVTVGGPPVKNTEVTCSVNGGTPFACITDEDGKLYLWMPAGDGAAEVNVDGTIFRANGTVKDNYDNVMLALTDPVVTGVVVTPSSPTAASGSTVRFSALVEGRYNPPQTVTWTVENGHQGTAIDDSGLLTISLDESSRTLRVTATSTYDSSQSGTTEVTVVYVPGIVVGVIFLVIFLLLFAVFLGMAISSRRR
jgi:hypothetical protein